MLRIAIASDIHASGSSSEYDGFVSSLPDAQDLHRNSLMALINYVRHHEIKADYLLCPGDLGEKANTEGIGYAWARLSELAGALGNATLLATTGNHDVDSRHKHNKFDPDGFLRQLNPPYPTRCDKLNQQYWSRHFYCISKNQHRILVLNSSAFHPYISEETEHGRISDWTLASIKKFLAASDRKRVNVLMCHHHPLAHEEHALGGHDTMKQGVLDILHE